MKGSTRAGWLWGARAPRALAMAPRHRGLFLLSITHLGAQPNPGPPRLRIKPLMDANRGAIELFIRL